MLKNQLSTLTRGTESISVYMQHSKALDDQLTALGSLVSMDDLAHAITKGLGRNYTPFVRAFENRHDDVLFDDLYGLLLSEESGLKQLEKPVESFNVIANFVQCSNYDGLTGRSHR